MYKVGMPSSVARFLNCEDNTMLSKSLYFSLKYRTQNYFSHTIVHQKSCRETAIVFKIKNILNKN